MSWGEQEREGLESESTVVVRKFCAALLTADEGMTSSEKVYNTNLTEFVFDRPFCSSNSS